MSLLANDLFGFLCLASVQGAAFEPRPANRLGGAETRPPGFPGWNQMRTGDQYLAPWKQNPQERSWLLAFAPRPEVSQTIVQSKPLGILFIPSTCSGHVCHRDPCGQSLAGTLNWLHHP